MVAELGSESLMQVDPDQNAELNAMQEVIGRNILMPLFECSIQSIIVLDADSLQIVAANRHARQTLGKSMRTLRRMVISDAVPDLPEATVRRFLNRFMRLSRREIRLRIHLPIGLGATLDLHIRRIHDGERSIVINALDSTAAVNAIRSADEAEARMITAINTLSDGFVLYDSDDRMVICNETYRTFYPESAPAMTPGALFEDILKHGLENGQYADGVGREDAWLRERMHQHNTMTGAIEQKLANGRWLRIVERQTPDGGRVGLRVDITQLKEQGHALRRLAITDELTGLRNRRNLLEDISQMAQGLPADESVVVFHLDLDRFKAVNDVYGHEAGDHVLKHAAKLLDECVASCGFAARVGGDEFIVVRRMKLDRASISAFAERIIARLTDPIGYAGQYMHIGASIGIAMLELDLGMTARGTVLTAADLALYEAKRLGGCALYFENYMRDNVLQLNALARELQVGLERQEFEAYFQPQIDASNKTCIGFEALLRWNHPRRGVLNAGQFLEVAQRAGLTDALDTLMMDAACRGLRWLHDQGWTDTSISINMSTVQLSDPRLLQRIEFALAKYNAPRHLLHIELLESTLLDERTSHFLINVKDMVEAGFTVELDDFGTGHAAIAALRKFRVSQIKIDRSFVRFIDTDVELQKLTSAIIGMAHSLEISVLAEGVETAAEQQWLLERGCRLAQGWFYARAMPLAEIADFLCRFPASNQNRVSVSPRSIRGVN